MTTTFERFQDLLTNKFSVPAEKISPQASLDDLGLDSLDLIEVLFEVEDTFDIRVPQDGGALKTATVQDILNSIDELTAAGAGRAAGSP
jgi:acyl carrier protein